MSQIVPSHQKPSFASAQFWPASIHRMSSVIAPLPPCNLEISSSTSPHSHRAPAGRVTLLWDDAVKQYLDSLYDPKHPDKATNRPATKKDYRSKLAVVELRVFAGRAISTITPEEIAEANAKTCRRAYDMGAGSFRTLKAFWV
jgi:hypothetical protein